ncbi:MAG: acyltransferase [Tepidisphaeraceae bacterium]
MSTATSPSPVAAPTLESLATPPAATTSLRKSHANNFDFLRIFLACLVVVSHSFVLSQGTEENEPMRRLTPQLITFGSIAVNGFFIISGFLITQSWEASVGVLDYFVKRIARIYPAFIVACIVGLFIIPKLSIGTWWNEGSPSPKMAVFDVLRLRGVWNVKALPDNPFPFITNGSLWTISYEFLCYVGVAILGLLTLLRRRGVLLTLFAASLVLTYLYDSQTLTWEWKKPWTFFGTITIWARFAPMYLAGMVFYVFRDRIPLNLPLAIVAAALLAGVAFVPHTWCVALPTLGAYLIFWFAFCPAIRLHRTAAWGDFSYGVYLFSFPLQQLIVTWFGGRIHWSTLLAISLPGSILVAALSWHLVERWPLDWAKRWAKRRRLAKAA